MMVRVNLSYILSSSGASPRPDTPRPDKRQPVLSLLR